MLFDQIMGLEVTSVTEIRQEILFNHCLITPPASRTSEDYPRLHLISDIPAKIFQ
jgi:hypothetical protein